MMHRVLSVLTSRNMILSLPARQNLFSLRANLHLAFDQAHFIIVHHHHVVVAMHP